MNVGLTGGIGCGKTTVVESFAKLGWRTVQSDKVVRDLIENDDLVRDAILGRWGGEVLNKEIHSINRQAVAEIVFNDSEELNWLEELLHPKVRQVWAASLSQDASARVLVEIPLLFEKSLETAFDLTVCITSPLEIVSKRMLQRGFNEVDIQRRMARQLPLAAKVKRANYVLSNSGSLEFLYKQVNRLNEIISTS